MGKSKELSFEPSRKLSVLTGIFEGISERKANLEAQEQAAAKNQSALMRQLIPQLFQQRRFEQTEQREREEFQATETRGRTEFQQGLTQKVSEFNYKKESDKLSREFALQLSGLEHSQQLTTDNINNLFKLKLQELNQTFDLRIQQSQQTFTDQQRQKGETFRAGESGKGRTFTTEEREASQTFREIENELDRDLQRDLRGKIFEDAEQVVLTNYQNAAKEYKDVLDLLANPANLKNKFLNRQAVLAADEMARWATELTPIYESKGLAPPLIPPKIQPFVQKFLARDTQFGFLPRLEVPTDVETIDEPVEAVETQPSKKISAIEKAITPKTTAKVQLAIDAAKDGKHTTLSPTHIEGLKTAGYSDDEIAQVVAGLRAGL